MRDAAQVGRRLRHDATGDAGARRGRPAAIPANVRITHRATTTGGEPEPIWLKRPLDRSTFSGDWPLRRTRNDEIDRRSRSRLERELRRPLRHGHQSVSRMASASQEADESGCQELARSSQSAARRHGAYVMTDAHGIGPMANGTCVYLARFLARENTEADGDHDPPRLRGRCGRDRATRRARFRSSTTRAIARRRGGRRDPGRHLCARLERDRGSVSPDARACRAAAGPHRAHEPTHSPGGRQSSGTAARTATADHLGRATGWSELGATRVPVASRGADGDAGVVDDEARRVVDELALEVEAWGAVLVALAAGAIG
jgi:hypothetical protein